MYVLTYITSTSYNYVTTKAIQNGDQTATHYAAKYEQSFQFYRRHIETHYITILESKSCKGDGPINIKRPRLF